MSNQTLDLGAILSAVMATEGDNTRAALSSSIEITPDMFAGIVNSEWLDNMPAFEVFAPKEAYSSSTLVYAKFAIRVHREDGKAVIDPSPRSVYAAVNRRTMSAAINPAPLGQSSGPCHINVDSATLLSLEVDDEVGIMPIPYYRQAAKVPAKHTPRGFSVKFTLDPTRDLPRHTQALVNNFRMEIAEALCRLKDRIGASGSTGAMIVNLIGFCTTPEEISVSMSSVERDEAKAKFKENYNDKCLGVSFPKGGFILAAQPVSDNKNIGFNENRVPETVQDSVRDAMKAHMRRRPGKRTVRFVADVPKGESTATTEVFNMEDYKVLTPKDRLFIIGKACANKYGAEADITNQLRSVYALMHNGTISSVTDAVLAAHAPSVPSIVSLREFAMGLFNADLQFANAQVYAKKNAAPAIATPTPVTTPEVVEAPPIPSPSSNEASALALLRSCGGMEDAEDFSPSTPVQDDEIPSNVIDSSAWNA